MLVCAKCAGNNEHFEFYAADEADADNRAVLDEDPDTGILAFVRECVYALISFEGSKDSYSIDASGIADFLIGLSLSAQFYGGVVFALFLPFFLTIEMCFACRTRRMDERERA